VGVLKFQLHLVIVLCYLYHNINFEELPVIEPNDYLFNHFKNMGRDRWEIYAEAVREIMCEIGDLKKSNKNYNSINHSQN